MAALVITTTIAVVSIVVAITSMIGPMGSMPPVMRPPVPMAPVSVLTVPIPMREAVA